MPTLCRYSLIVAGLAALLACAPDAPEERPTEAERREALRDSAFGGLVEPMDRAAGVEQLQLDRKRELDEAIEQ
ncbi:MAG TPA: hypothetical protein VLD39_01655 [Gammaproteobacteria bacterium]|nr:hypothetical protein [Gammaproteobacteria bacterium]